MGRKRRGNKVTEAERHTSSKAEACRQRVSCGDAVVITDVVITDVVMVCTRPARGVGGFRYTVEEYVPPAPTPACPPPTLVCLWPRRCRSPSASFHPMGAATVTLPLTPLPVKECPAHYA
jgi:hypothetical protein